MGNDGGDIPGRKQLVKQRKKVQIPSAQTIAISRSRFCNLTNQRFKQPLAICRLGYLYNYQAILSTLLQKTLPSKYSYIRKLSDIKQVIIERTSEESLNYIACPITKLQYNGFNKFVAIWKCGHVLSRKAFKQVKTIEKKCIICDSDYDEKDIIDLNLEGQQINHMRNALIKKKQKNDKKEQKQEQIEGQPTKKVKKCFINPLQRLSGQFRDVLRQRSKFKEMFHK